jgi:hypothetical protein
MISSPGGYSALDVEQEGNAPTEALAEPLAAGRIMAERLRANMNTCGAAFASKSFMYSTSSTTACMARLGRWRPGHGGSQ